MDYILEGNGAWNVTPTRYFIHDHSTEVTEGQISGNPSHTNVSVDDWTVSKKNEIV